MFEIKYPHRRRMHFFRLPQLIWLGGVLALLTASSATATWFGGGGYDGYSDDAAQGRLGYPQVNNAAGATNIMATSAYLNGRLLTTGGASAQVVVYWGKNGWRKRYR